MARPASKDEIENAPRVVNVEHDYVLNKAPVLLKSSHDNLGYLSTIKQFWKVMDIVVPVQLQDLTR